MTVLKPSQLGPMPVATRALPRTLTRRALDNAIFAAERLTAQNRDRAALRPVTDSTNPGVASTGQVTRLSRDESMRLLQTRRVGRFAYVAHTDTPDVVPVNYTVDEQRRILLRSGPGPKLLAAQRHARIAFEVDDIDEVTRIGWSVVVFGRAEVLPYRVQQPNGPAEPWAAGPRCHVICITPHRVEGRRLH